MISRSLVGTQRSCCALSHSRASHIDPSTLSRPDSLPTTSWLVPIVIRTVICMSSSSASNPAPAASQPSDVKKGKRKATASKGTSDDGQSEGGPQKRNRVNVVNLAFFLLCLSHSYLQGVPTSIRILVKLTSVLVHPLGPF